MKQLILLLFAAFALGSCHGVYLVIEDLEPVEVADDQAYISVTVTTEAEDACDDACAYKGEYVVGVEDALVEIELMDEERPFASETNTQGYTDDQGRFLFEDLPNGTYRVVIKSRQGNFEEQVSAPLGKVTKVHVRL